jgi:hypothetical protein
MIDQAEGFPGHGVDGLLQRKYSGSEPGPLVRHAVLANPFANKSLFFCVREVEFDEGLLRALTARSNIGMESPERFLWNISSNAAVAFCVEIHSAPLRRNHTAPHGWRWMREGKTTLLNELAAHIPDTDRIVVTEKTAEIHLVKPNLGGSKREAPPSAAWPGGAASRRHDR